MKSCNHIHNTYLLILTHVCFFLFLSNIHLGWCQENDSFTPIEQIDSYQKILNTDTTRVDIRLKLAKVYLQIEDYAKALTEYNQVIANKNNPGTDENRVMAQTFYGLGLSYSGLEKFEKAIEAYLRAIHYTPEWGHIHAALGAAYANLHKYNTAINVYKTACDILPKDPMVHHQLGNIYNKQGKNDEAIKHQEYAIKLSPTLATAYYQLGLLYSKKNQFKKAISAYETAYTQDPELIEALYNLAQTYIRNGNRQEARKTMQLYEKHKVDIQSIHELRGALQRTQERIQKANILANIGRLYLKNNYYKKAVREYEKSIALNPEGLEALNGIGIVYTMLKRYPEAIEAQNKAIRLQPDFPEAYAGLGLAYFQQNENLLALNKYQKAIAVSRNKGDKRKLEFEEEVHLKIGILLLKQKEYNLAASSYQAVLYINPNNLEAYYNLGLVYAQQDDTVKALEQLTRVVKVAKTLQIQGESEPMILPETYFLMGELYAQQGKDDEAESAYLSSALPKAYNALAQLSAKLAEKLKQQPMREEKLQSATSYAKTAIRINPNIANYHNTLALIAYRNGDLQTAETSIRKAIELDPKNPNYREGLKQILKR